jgi:hypothetical protein
MTLRPQTEEPSVHSAHAMGFARHGRRRWQEPSEGSAAIRYFAMR